MKFLKNFGWNQPIKYGHFYMATIISLIVGAVELMAIFNWSPANLFKKTNKDDQTKETE